MPGEGLSQMERKAALSGPLAVVGVVLALVVTGGFIYADYLAPRAEARLIADRFWREVTAGDVAAVRGLLAPDAPQTADALVDLFRGYRYAARGDRVPLRIDAHSSNADGFLSSFISPKGYTVTYMIGLKRQKGVGMRVWFAAKGYTQAPDGSVCPTLTP